MIRRVRSMTGFGEGTAESTRLEIGATLRSVNHRFLDLAIRLPEEYRALESDLAQKLRDALGRGRVELRISVREIGTRQVAITVDEELAARYVEASNRLSQREGVTRHLTSGALLRLPEVILIDSGQALSDEDQEALAGAVDKALERLIAVRSREGAELADVLRRTLEELTAVVSALDASREALQAALHERCRTRLQELAGDAGLDEGRLAQEIALLVDRSDVQEEIDRLRVHLERFGALLGAQAPVGKRLDFLAQEILRELNTIGSKCRNSDAIQLVLEGKVRCEQLREQVQNVE